MGGAGEFVWRRGGAAEERRQDSPIPQASAASVDEVRRWCLPELDWVVAGGQPAQQANLLGGEIFADGGGDFVDGGGLGELVDGGGGGGVGRMDAEVRGDVADDSERGGDFLFGEQQDLEFEVIAFVGAAAEAGLAQEHE